jgi:hypothetical protein
MPCNQTAAWRHPVSAITSNNVLHMKENKEVTETSHPIYLRASPAHWARLTRLADRDRRTPSALARIMLEDAIDAAAAS